MSIDPLVLSFIAGALLSLLLYLVFSHWRKRREVSQSDVVSPIASTQKTRVAELEDEKTKISAILENMTEGVLAVDRNKRVLFTNPSANDLFQIREGSGIGRYVLEIVRNPAIDQMIDQAIANQTIVTEEIELHYPKRKILRANAVGIPIRDGDLSGILVFYDITEIRNLERLRQEFVANVSHELKTPLTSIKGFIETLSSGALEDRERARHFIKLMEEDADRLTRLIGDLLELSQIESKEAALKLAPVDLKGEIEKLIAQFDSHLKAKRLSVETHLENGLPLLLADRDRLKQVLLNLFDNAVKFNKQRGKIIFHTESIGNQIQVSIEDTGLGIPKEAIPRIFERFFRVDKA
ncbi:MAG: PAS domain-containing protein, partial [Candidatus Omnitrophica bacterium]|nr:PAS domain-containing protein [Candidatus Omnitrophota bacterium]